MPRRDYLLHHTRAAGQPYHPRRATRREKQRQREAVAVLAAAVLPAPDVLAAYLVSQSHGQSYARMASVQMHARAAKGCAVTLAVIRQLEDEAAP